MQQTQMRQHPVKQLSSSQHSDSTSDSAIPSNDSIEDTKPKQAFGASLDRNTIAVDEMWCKQWNKIVSSSRHYYDLPGGAVGREFVNVLAEEVNLLNRSSVCSERLIVFLAFVSGQLGYSSSSNLICGYTTDKIQNASHIYTENRQVTRPVGDAVPE